MELPIFWLWESGTALLSRKLSRVQPHSRVRRVLAQKGTERPCKHQDKPCPFHFGPCTAVQCRRTVLLSLLPSTGCVCSVLVGRAVWLFMCFCTHSCGDERKHPQHSAPDTADSLPPSVPSLLLWESLCAPLYLRVSPAT